MSLKKVLVGGAGALVGVLSWTAAVNGDFGPKKIKLHDGLRWRHDVVTFVDKYSVFPYKAVITTNKDVARVLFYRRQEPSQDWRKWTELVDIRVVSSIRPLEIDVGKLDGQDYFVELLEKELQTTKRAIEIPEAEQRAGQEWSKKYGHQLGPGWTE